MNKVPHCSECEYVKMYDYGNRIYYCDHADRIDDMGKLGADHPPKTSPEWCPKRVKTTDTRRKAIESARKAIESEINAKNSCSPCNVKIWD